MSNWKITYGSESREITGSINTAHETVRTLLRENGLDPEWICTLNTNHGYSGFYYWEEIDYMSEGELKRGIARIEQTFG